MKTVKLVAILAMCLVAFSVSAICPTQQTTIFFANGVNVDKKGPGGAEDSRDHLKEELLKDVRFHPECVAFDLAYNTNEPTFVADFVEAFIEKSAEVTGADDFPWAEWQNTVSTPDWFLQVVEKFISIPARVLIESGRWVLGDQRDEHVLAYQAEMAKGRKVILAAHSQGTINAREEWLALSPVEQSNAKIVGAAAFSFPEPDESRYTTMDEDKLAIGGLGLPSPPANIFLTLEDSLDCQPAVPNPWFCHEFIRSYMGILPARDKIVDDIISALPTATPPAFATIQGHVFRLSGGSATPAGAGVRVELLGAGTTLTQTVTDTSGFYSMGVPACDRTDDICTILATATNPAFLGFADIFSFSRIAGTTVTVNVTMFPL